MLRNSQNMEMHFYRCKCGHAIHTNEYTHFKCFTHSLRAVYVSTQWRADGLTKGLRITKLSKQSFGVKFSN